MNWQSVRKLCMGRKKNGDLCSKLARELYSEGKYFIIPLTCWQHKNQIPDIKERKNE